MSAKHKPQPIRDDELGALFKVFPRHGCVILAVSGGADSTAMLWLAARWRQSRPAGPELIAATVDHRLRRGSAREATAVAKFAASLGLAHHTLAWSGRKPKSGIEAAARAARYRLLGALAAECGAETMATAHTLDDQAETVLMRLAAGSGPAGLGGIRPVERLDGPTLVRPLLGVSKARLVATLRGAGIGWSEDPMNRDAAFARPRLRAAAAALAAEGLTAARLARLAARMQRVEAVVAAAKLPAVSAPADGRALVEGAEELAIRWLVAAIRAARGGGLKPHLPRLEQVEALWGEVKTAIEGGEALGRTLAGALIAVNRGGKVSVSLAPPRREQKAGKTGRLGRRT